MSHSPEAPAADARSATAAPIRPQAADASAPPMRLSSCATSVAAAAAAAESAAAAGAFLAEIDVIVDRGLDRIGIELHVLARQHFAFPGFRAHMRAPGECRAGQRQQRERAARRRK